MMFYLSICDFGTENTAFFDSLMMNKAAKKINILFLWLLLLTQYFPLVLSFSIYHDVLFFYLLLTQHFPLVLSFTIYHNDLFFYLLLTQHFPLVLSFTIYHDIAIVSKTRYRAKSTLKFTDLSTSLHTIVRFEANSECCFWGGFVTLVVNINRF